MPSRAKRIAICLSAALLLASWALTIDGFFTCPDILRSTNQERGEAVAEAHGASLESVSIRASDGATLRGWLFTPKDYRGRAGLLVHAGVGNRHEMLVPAEWLLQRGYACLLVDQRGCGTSGGLISWGVNEPADIAAWATWLHDRTHASALFGYGRSRGSATLLQSLALKAPFTGLVLAATGAGNVAQPYQLIGDKMGISERSARTIWWPLIEPSFWWIRVHYGFDMREALDGVSAIRGSQVAVLLIHGSEDRLAAAERLRDANPQHTDLVVIPGADHEWFSLDRPEVMKLVLAWFEAHAKS
jgi:alpha-beta hydrolase superfamily lysophospholipase